MRLHITVLGWLHLAWGGFAVLAGLSLGVLAAGTSVARTDLAASPASAAAAIWLFLIVGLAFVAAGAVMALVGRALVRRDRRGRTAALLASCANLAVVPFGTALGVYCFWTLLNDDARAEFARPDAAAGR